MVAALLFLVLAASQAMPAWSGARPGRRPGDAGADTPSPQFIDLVVRHEQEVMKQVSRYCFHQYIVQERLGENDQPEKREWRRELVCYLGDTPRYRRLTINGQATGWKDSDAWPPQKEDDWWRKHKKEAAERDARFQELISEIPKAFVLSRVKDEMMDGRQTTLFKLTPNPSYKPHSTATEMLKHVSAQAWVDMQAAQMVRISAVVESDFDVLAGLALKIRKGGTFEMAQRPIGGAWLPYYSEYRGHARIALVKHIGWHERVDRSDFAPGVRAGKAGD